MTDIVETGIIHEQEPSKINLPPELQKYVSVKKLEQNFSLYPEMQLELSGEQKRKVKIIKNTLLQLPLVHATKKPFEKGVPIVPTIDLPEGARSHTFGLDKSLGLDKYTFFHWGVPARSDHGTHFLLVNPSLLQSPNTIVTPCDIGDIALVGNDPFDKVEKDKKERYQKEYLDKMVSGENWVEINARKVLKSIEGGNPFYGLNRNTLGEVKHLGPVSADLITTQISFEDLQYHYKFLYEHGFSIPNIEQERRLYLRLGIRNGADPLPEECGIDYEEAAEFWDKSLK